MSKGYQNGNGNLKGSEQQTSFKKKGDNKVVTKVSDELKAELVRKLVSYGFKFGGVVRDDSIKSGVEVNMIIVDENSNGWEIKFKSTQFALYELKNGYSCNRHWIDYKDFDEVFEVQ